MRRTNRTSTRYPYRIELELDKDVKATAHLISEEFEMVVEDCYLSSDRRISIPFLIEEPGNCYFRMYPREPVRITRLAIIPLENKTPSESKKLSHD